MACSVDYIIAQPGETEQKMGFVGPGVLQIKNSDYLQHRAEWTNSEPPFHIILQLQHEIACTGLSWGAIGVLKGGNEVLVYRYPASAKMATAIRNRVKEFWDDVREGRIPNVDGTDSTADTLKALYPSVPNPIPKDFTGDKEFMNACVGFLNAAANNAQSKKAYDDAKNFLESKLQGVTSAKGDGFSVTVSVPADKPDRFAKEGELIKGRKGGRTIRIREITNG
jgi:hypothetical protein